MIEVFKTDVPNLYQAKILIDQIHQRFCDYKANFDLEDCDRVLRISCANGLIDASILIHLLKDFGFTAEVLPD